MNPCLFCNIVRGKVDALKIFEDNHVVAFLDINPSSPGHTMIIPKYHAATIFKLPPKEGYALLDAIRAIAKHIQNVMGADGLNIGWNHESAAGQVVEHLHIHIIPRWEGDRGQSIQSLVQREQNKPLQEIAEELKFTKSA